MENEQALDLSAMLNSVLQNPEQMAQLQEMAAALGLGTPSPTNTQSDSPAAEAAPPTTAAQADLSSLLPMLKTTGGHKKAKPDQRTALLMALRPYLSDSRREMVDAIVNFSRLGSMLSTKRED